MSYTGRLSEDGRVTKVVLFAKYLSEENSVIVRSQQWVAARHTPGMLAVSKEMKRRLLAGGVVKKISVRRDSSGDRQRGFEINSEKSHTNTDVADAAQ